MKTLPVFLLVSLPALTFGQYSFNPLGDRPGANIDYATFGVSGDGRVAVGNGNGTWQWVGRTYHDLPIESNVNTDPRICTSDGSSVYGMHNGSLFRTSVSFTILGIQNSSLQKPQTPSGFTLNTDSVTVNASDSAIVSSWFNTGPTLQPIYLWGGSANAAMIEFGFPSPIFPDVAFSLAYSPSISANGQYVAARIIDSNNSAAVGFWTKSGATWIGVYSKAVVPSPNKQVVVSNNGRAFFVSGNSIYQYDSSTGLSTKIDQATGENPTVTNIIACSSDGSIIAFESGANSYLCFPIESQLGPNRIKSTESLITGGIPSPWTNFRVTGIASSSTADPNASPQQSVLLGTANNGSKRRPVVLINGLASPVADSFKCPDGLYNVSMPAPGILFNDLRLADGVTIEVTQQPLWGSVSVSQTGAFTYIMGTLHDVYQDSFQYRLLRPGSAPSSPVTVTLVN